MDLTIFVLLLLIPSIAFNMVIPGYILYRDVLASVKSAQRSENIDLYLDMKSRNGHDSGAALDSGSDKAGNQHAPTSTMTLSLSRKDSERSLVSHYNSLNNIEEGREEGQEDAYGSGIAQSDTVSIPAYQEERPALSVADDSYSVCDREDGPPGSRSGSVKSVPISPVSLRKENSSSPMLSKAKGAKTGAFGRVGVITTNRSPSPAFGTSTGVAGAGSEAPSRRMNKSGSYGNLLKRGRARTASDVTMQDATRHPGRTGRGLDTAMDQDDTDGIRSKSEAENFLRTLSTLEKEPPKTMII